jgi:hypothetical protein
MTRESPITRTSLLDVIQQAEAALPSLMGLASRASPIGLRENNALYFELMNTLLRADDAGIIFEDDLLVVRLCRLVDTLTAQLRTHIALQPK